MKKIILIALVVTAFVSCKNDKKETNEEVETNNTIENVVAENTDKNLFKGEYVFHDGVGVFQTNTEIYGVLENDIMSQLNEKAKELKKEPTDMVMAIVKAEISTEKHDKILWEKKLILKKVLSVSEVKTNNVVKLGS